MSSPISSPPRGASWRDQRMAATGSARKAKPLGLLALGFLGAAALGGCNDEAITGSIAPDDYHNRHPIVLTNGPTELDVFPTGQTALDARSAASVRDFAERYAQYGVGRIVILTPAGG